MITFGQDHPVDVERTFGFDIDFASSDRATVCWDICKTQIPLGIMSGTQVQEP
jgi:hypothetical protein